MHYQEDPQCEEVVEPGVGGHRGQEGEEGGEAEAKAVDPLPAHKLGQAAAHDLGGDVPVAEGAEEQAPLEGVPRQRAVGLGGCRIQGGCVG